MFFVARLTDQLIELEKASMARLLCNGGNNIRSMQEHVFELISEV